MTIPTFFYRSVLTGALSLTALLSWAADGSAATYVVQNTNTTGTGSLRAALASARADSDASDNITFAPGVTGTISTGGTEFAIGKSMTLTGPGANALTLDGASSSRVLHVTAGTALISGLRLTKGNAITGGGFQADLGSTVTLRSLAIDHSNAVVGTGGGISNAGTLTLQGCVLSADTATTTGGGLFNAGTATLTDCTLAGNSATLGGGVLTTGSLALVSCTVTGNTATLGQGGGVWVGLLGTAGLKSSLVAANTGTNLFADINLVLGQSGVLTSLGSNLIGDATGNGFTNGANHDLTGVTAPKLGALAANGGPTATCALLAGSPAIDADYNSGAPLDQRGYTRAGNGVRSDIGAFEAGAAPAVTLSTITVTAGSPLVSIGGTNPLTATATYSDGSTANVTNTAVWASDSPATATVTATGLAAGVAAGIAHITATVGSVTSSAFALQVHALANLVVTNALDDGSPGCLRTVLASAGPGDTITFAANVTGTITLNGTELATLQSVAIQGPGANVLTISANNASRVFNFMNSFATDSLSGLTLTAGSAGSQSGGAVSSLGTLTVTGCAVTGSTGGYGGGLFSAGPLVVKGSTFSGDTASYGGGLCSQATATVTNSTFSGDTATVNGGGLFTLAGLTVISDTFAGNFAPGGSGGGLYKDTLLPVTVKASLFAGSTGGDLAASGGTFTSGGSNLLGDAGPSAFSAAGSHDQFGVSAAAAKLGPLADNGGPTPTCAVLVGSPAINADYALATTVDQRGTARGAATHTIGAFEFIPVPVPVQYTHLLWTKTDGTASIWSISSDGTVRSTPSLGPMAGWTAISIADGTDSTTRLLWTKTDGSSVVWTVNDADGTYVSTPAYGPYDGGHWSITGLAVGADNLTRLQWKHSPDGKSSVWTIAANGTPLSSPGYGPYGAWTAGALAVGSDGLSRLLWGDGTGTFSIWTIDTSGTTTSTPSFSPAGFTPGGIAGGPDMNTRLLLNRTDGAMAIWTVTGAGSVTSTPLYGPMAGWNCHGLAVGADALSRVLWSRTDGASAVWTIQAGGAMTSTPLYGPMAGWSAVSVSVGP